MDYDVAYCEIKSNENQSNPIASNLMGGVWIWAEKVNGRDKVTRLKDSLHEEACFRVEEVNRSSDPATDGQLELLQNLERVGILFQLSLKTNYVI